MSTPPKYVYVIFRGNFPYQAFLDAKKRDEAFDRCVEEDSMQAHSWSTMSVPLVLSEDEAI